MVGTADAGVCAAVRCVAPQAAAGLVATVRLWPGIAGPSGVGRARVAVLWTRFLTPRAGVEQEVSLLLISL